MRIIVLVDFSLYTNSLIKVATKWAELYDAGLILVHEVPRLVPAMADDGTRYKIIDFEKEEALSKLEDLAERTIPDQIPVTFEVTERRLTNFLPQLIPDKEKALLMMGLKGTGLLKQIFIGSIATEIINELNKITVGVPLKINQTSPECLIIPVDQKYPFNEKKLSQLLTILGPLIKDISFITIDRSNGENNEQLKYLKELSDRFNGGIATFHKMFKSQNAFEELKSYTNQKENSFLVVQKGGRSFTDRVLKRFLINRIVHDGSIPLIVLPE